MAEGVPDKPEYRHTMDTLEGARHEAASGATYWLAREIQPILGYATWDGFEAVIGRATDTLTHNDVSPSHHVRETSKMVGVGSGAKRPVRDYFLSRLACYLIAMNGDPSKPEIAAAQAYFALKTREAELAQAQSEDEKRLELRPKVSKSFRKVAGIAKEAGVANTRQAIFHDARYLGLYGSSCRELKAARRLGEKENPFDRMGSLELSANDFQMNLAAETIRNEGIKGERAAIEKNRAIAARVRKTMIDSGSPPPEELPVAEPIKQVERRIRQTRKIAKNPT